MRNERLRALLLEKGKTPGQLADAAQVDAKTVERWITKGRQPYRRHRFEVAAFLGVDESYIWPDALRRDEVAVVSESEVVAVYPHRTCPDARRTVARPRLELVPACPRRQHPWCRR